METQHVGRIIRDKRERKRLTIAQAAELAGLSEIGLELIELGDSAPKFSSVIKIAAVLDIDLGDLNSCKPETNPDTVLTV